MMFFFTPTRLISAFEIVRTRANLIKILGANFGYCKVLFNK